MNPPKPNQSIEEAAKDIFPDIINPWKRLDIETSFKAGYNLSLARIEELEKMVEMMEGAINFYSTRLDYRGIGKILEDKGKRARECKAKLEEFRAKK